MLKVPALECGVMRVESEAANTIAKINAELLERGVSVERRSSQSGAVSPEAKTSSR